MTQPRLLVIGSQCQILNRLDFLPAVAESLHALLIHPGPGECVGIPLEGRPPGLLLDPTVGQVKAAIKSAIEEAAEAGATLILAYIGHGEFPDERTGDFYLMPTDATEPTSDGAIHFAECIKDRIKLRRDHAGLLVLLDACHAGAGAWQSMERWAQSLRGNIGFELLTAADDRATANAPLARALIELLEKGDPEAGMRLHGRDLHRLLKDRKRPAQHVAYNAEDARLSLARNIARDPGDVFWKDSQGRDQILKQTEYFQPTPQLDALVEATRSHAVVVLTGDAGAGKSTLAAALARPEVAGGRVPAGFVHAIAVLNNDTNQRRLASDLEGQLRRSIPAFAGAIEEFEKSEKLEDRERLDFLPQMVLEPLKYLAGQPAVRIVLDGFNQLPEVTREAVGAMLKAGPRHLRLVITTRPDTPGCPPGHFLHHGSTLREYLDRYLAMRGVSNAARPAILDRAQGNFLIARLLAQAVLSNPRLALNQLPRTVDEAYAKLLDQTKAADAWKEKFRPVLGLLAVAGSGPVIPLRLVARATKGLAGPKDARGVRAVLARLGGLVARRDSGVTCETVGLFHSTLVEYLLGPSAASVGYGVAAHEAHRAIIQAIETLAPMAKHNNEDLVHRYAFTREVHHLWAVDDYERALASLRHRLSNVPRENLERWRQGLALFRERFDVTQPYFLELRKEVAFWHGQSGEPREALRLSAELLPDLKRELGPDHRETLGLRYNSAVWTGQAKAGDLGAAREALKLITELLPDQERVFGRHHPDTLTIRCGLAVWSAISGRLFQALVLFAEVVRDMERELGRDHPDTLETRELFKFWSDVVASFAPPDR